MGNAEGTETVELASLAGARLPNVLEAVPAAMEMLSSPSPVILLIVTNRVAPAPDLP